MKKTILIVALLATIISCGENKAKPAAGEKKPGDVATNPAHEKGLDLVAKSDCFTCHKVADPSVGPAYTEVAKRYEGKAGAEDSLSQKIIKGGVGNWGSVPMKSHPEISDEDARTMVKYILTINQ